MSLQYDVFISYSSKNSDWVHNTLKPFLVSRGISVITDAMFKGGGYADEQMEEAVVNSRRVIAVMTPDFFQSGWTKLEAAMARVLDPAAVDRKLIPVMLIKCQLPLRFQVMTYRDLSKNDADQWDKLITDLV